MPDQDNNNAVYTHAQLQDAYNQGYTDHGALADTATRQHQAVLDTMQKIQLELRAQGATQHLQGFDGEGSDKFQLWLQDLERTLTQLGGDDARARVLVLQTLSGPAAEFANREIRKNGNITWKKLKEKLTARYSDMSDLAFAKHKLRRMVQGKSESVQNFYERLLTVAKSAYTEEKLQEEYIQLEMVEHFLDGLTDDGMVRRLIRLKPKTLDDALQKATDEQQAQKSFKLRRGHVTEQESTPMEVNVVTARDDQLNSTLSKMADVLQRTTDLQLEALETNQYPMDVDMVATLNNTFETTLNRMADMFENVQQSLQRVERNLRDLNTKPMGITDHPRDDQGRFARLAERNQYWTNNNPADKPMVCYRCGKRGHISTQCWSQRNNGTNQNNPNIPRQGTQFGNQTPYNRPTYAQVVSSNPHPFSKNE